MIAIKCCRSSSFLITALAGGLFLICCTAQAAASVWPAIDAQCRPWTYWWWMGSAVDKDSLAVQLEAFQKAGLGGVHIIPIYGAKGYEQRYIKYLSPQWMEMLDYTVRQARQLGMGVDMTLGTGWCFGGPTITNQQANAVVEHAVHTVEGGQSSVKVKSASPLYIAAYGPQGEIVDLTGRVKSDGTLDWTASEGTWRVYELWQKPSGRKVKRAAPGGEGHMLNPFYREAMEEYLAWFDKALKDYSGLKPRATYHDSYEYVSNWSPDLLSEFYKRRGYRLEDFLPELLGYSQDSERTARLKGDYRQTLSDLMVDNYSLWVQWSHKNGFITRNEAHGSPGNLLDLYALADIPETEFFRLDRNPLVAKFASSAAHTAGHRRTSSETGTWLKEHFHVTLGHLKNFIDGLFVSGINHVFYHGSCYSPNDADWPGWVFYASTQMNPRNSIWHDADALNDYISRCQSVLQAGRPDNDLLVYWPVSDYWHNPKGMNLDMTVHSTQWLAQQPIGRLAEELWKKGYAFDYISDRQLQQAHYEGGKIKVPGGDYRAVVVPNCTHIPLDTLQRLFLLAQQGAVILFEKSIPQDVPGLGDLEKRRAALKSLIDSIAWQPQSGFVKTGKVGQGVFCISEEVEPLMNQAGIQRESLVDHKGLYYIRRMDDKGYWYFITNQDEQFTENPSTSAFSGWITLTRRAQSIFIMDPMDGKTGLGDIRQTQDGMTQVYFQLQPGQSLILRLLNENQKDAVRWKWYQDADSVTLKGTWKVDFVAGGPQLPPSFSTETLESWTKQGPEAQRFAGTARYCLAFDWPQIEADAWRLDLGKVASSARVRLNGQSLGTVFSEPFAVDIPKAMLKSGENQLEIEVTNLSANRIRDLDIRGVPWKYFGDINMVNIDYKTFDASQWEIVESGLLGPVRLTALSRYRPQ